MDGPKHITILGGGVAGLAIGHYARKKSLSFTVYEADDQMGGNCRTIKNGPFRFDTGSHRFHDIDHEITREVCSLLGNDLKAVCSSSQIYHNGKFIDFPLSPMNLFLGLGLRSSIKAGIEFMSGKLKHTNEINCFESFAHSIYGRTVAKHLLLNYSEKLWGMPGRELSPAIAGNRMKGLNFGAFMREIIIGSGGKTRHLEGSFFYPAKGIFMIPERLALSLGMENIRTRSRITRLFHNGNRVQAVQINDSGRILTDHVVSTLPLDILIKILEPPAPIEILDRAHRLSYRSIRQVAIFLNKDRVLTNASVYFPDRKFPFTRVYEPKNRSALMAPAGLTSLVAEIPCSPDDTAWTEDDDSLTKQVQTIYERLGWVQSHEVLGNATERLSYAYPILTKSSEETVDAIMSYLERFCNLELTGRNGLFQYAHIHDMMRFGMEYVESCLSKSRRQD